MMKTYKEISKVNVLSKLLAVILIINLTFANICMLGVNLISYAGTEELDNQNTLIKNQNIEFDAYFDNGNITHYLTADVNSENNINMSIELLKDGYLKNAVIEFLGEKENDDANFIISDTSKKLDMVQKLKDKTIELKQIDAGEKITLQLPIGIDIQSKFELSKLNKISRVVLKGTYIDSKGKANEIEKEIKLNVKWTGEYEAQLEQEILKYIPFENGALVQVLVKSNIRQDETRKNVLPIKQTNIMSNAPKINGKKPLDATVYAKTTTATNRKVEDTTSTSNDDWKYDKENGVTYIQTENQIIDGMVYVGNGADEYVITYTYGKEAILNEDIEFESYIKSKIYLYTCDDEKYIEANSNVKTTLEGKIGSIVSTEIKTDNNIINKGKMYANLNSDEKTYETTYLSKLQTNISYKNGIEKLIIQDSTDKFLDENNNEYSLDINENNYSYYKQTVITKSNFTQILGEDGYIKILDKDGNQLFIINKDSRTYANKMYVINYENMVDKITIETSKPIAEGNLVINHIKAIKPDLPYSKEHIKSFRKLEVLDKTFVKYENVDNIYLMNESKLQFDLEETKTNATIELGKNTLSTIANNENIDITIKLNNNKETSDLYSNPVFIVQLPPYVTDVNVKSANLLYNEGLKIKSIERFDQSGLVKLRIELEGTESKFSTGGELTNGTNIVLNTDISVNVLAPTSIQTMKMYYYNENVNTYETEAIATSPKAGYASYDVNLEAPKGLVSVTGVENYNDNQKVMSVNQGEKTGKIQILEPAKTAKMRLLVINNTGNMCNQIVSLGRFPFKDNKDVYTEEALGTTVDVALKSFINPKNATAMNFTIYYSENPDATADLTNPGNGWTLENIDLSKVKSYLIVGNGYDMEVGSIAEFNYEFEVPANLQHNNSIYGSFGTYYNNNTEVASIQEFSKADKVGISTGRGAELKIEQKVIGTNNDYVDEGSRIKYAITVSNIGEEVAENVVISDRIPQGTEYVKRMPSLQVSQTEVTSYQLYSSNEDKSEDIMNRWNVLENATDENSTPKVGWSIGNLNAGETVTKEFEVLVSDLPEIESYYSNIGEVSKENDKYYLTTIKQENGEEIEEKTEINGLPEIKISNTAEVSASNLDKVLQTTAEETTVLESEFEIREDYVFELSNVSENKEVTFYLSAKNNTEKDLNNVIIKKVLPNEVSYSTAYISVTDDEGDETNRIYGEYNKDTREITIKLDNIKAGEYISGVFTVKTNKLDTGVYEKDVITNSTISADGTRTYTSGENKITIVKPKIVLKHESNQSNQFVSAGDIIEYTFTVTNEGKATANGVRIQQNIPDSLELVSAEYKLGDIESSAITDENNNVVVYCSLATQDTLVLKVVVKVSPVSKEESVISAVSLEGTNTDFIMTDGIINTIEATASNENTGNETGSGEGNQTGSSSGNTTAGFKSYKIVGTAWEDSNGDGQKGSNEPVIRDIKVRLLNASTGETIVDLMTGDEKVTTTNEYGKYEFVNLVEGNYIVVFEYDYKNYVLSEYKKAGVQEDVNSDVIEGKYKQNSETIKVAVTDTIQITTSSISGVNIGLVKGDRFDLKLDKTVNKVTVQSTKGTKTYDFNGKMAKVDIAAKEVINATVVIDYAITVTNEGSVQAYAKSIIDYMPKDLVFNSELNKDWYLGNDDYLYSTALGEQVINPGESKTINLVLTKKLAGENTGLINNNAEIQEDYNEKGLKELDSVAGNRAQGEDDLSSADVLLTVKTGGPVMYTAIILGIVAILGVGVYVIKKELYK